LAVQELTALVAVAVADKINLLAQAVVEVQ
jgi:hypothetical protein